MLPFVGAALWRQRAAVRAEAGQLLVLGALGMWVCGAWVNLGGKTTSATNIALIYAATPVAIAVAGVKLLHERMRPAQRLAVAALMPGALSYVAHSYLQRELGAARTALMLYLAPVYGALAAWWLLGETPGWVHVVGAALILPSIWLATRRG